MTKLHAALPIGPDHHSHSASLYVQSFTFAHISRRAQASVSCDFLTLTVNTMLRTWSGRSVALHNEVGTKLPASPPLP